ncbi:MAG: hypothetical protein AABZ06_01500 [Bdellovibrionota bacterium]
MFRNARKMTVFSLIAIFVFVAATSNNANRKPAANEDCPSCGVTKQGGVGVKIDPNLAKGDRLTVFADCHTKLKDEEALRLLAELNDINGLFFSGELSDRERNKRLDSLMKSMNPENDPVKAGVIKAYIASMAQQAADDSFQRLALAKVHGKQCSNVLSAIGAIAKVGVPQAEIPQKIEEHAERIKSYAEALTGLGAKYDPDTGWDLQNVDMAEAAKKAASDSMLNSAFALMFRGDFLKQVNNPERAETIIASGYAYLPPTKENGGKVKVMPYTQYHQRVQIWLKNYERDLKDYIEGSEAGSKFSNQVQGSFYKKDFGKEKRAWEHQRDDGWKRSNMDLKVLKNTLGISKQHHTALKSALQESLKLERKYLDIGSAKIKAGITATVTAPLLPLMMWGAPLLVGGGAATSAAVGTMGIVPVAFGLGLGVVDASIESIKNGGNFFCHLAEQVAEKGAPSLYTAPIFATIPVGAGLAGAGALALGASTSTAGAIVGGINITAAVGFTGMMLYSGGAEALECREGFRRAEEEYKNGRGELAESIVAENIKKCASAGINLAFAIPAGVGIGKKGIDAAKSWKKETAEKKGQALVEEGKAAKPAEPAEAGKAAEATVSDFTPPELSADRAINIKGEFKEVFEIQSEGGTKPFLAADRNNLQAIEVLAKDGYKPAEVAEIFKEFKPELESMAPADRPYAAKAISAMKQRYITEPKVAVTERIRKAFQEVMQSCGITPGAGKVK